MSLTFVVADHKLNVSLVNEENQEVKDLGDRFLQVIVRKLAKLFNRSYSSFETCKTKKAKEILRSGGNKDVGTVQKCARINRKQTKITSSKTMNSRAVGTWRCVVQTHFRAHDQYAEVFDWLNAIPFTPDKTQLQIARWSL